VVGNALRLRRLDPRPAASQGSAHPLGPGSLDSGLGNTGNTAGEVAVPLAESNRKEEGPSGPIEPWRAFRP
jgi:hypothetical protein